MTQRTPGGASTGPSASGVRTRDARTRDARAREARARGVRTRDVGARDRVVRAEPAGQDLTDEEMLEQVAEQTSHDRVASTFFEEERRGARNDTEAAKFRSARRSR